jgi:GxxExxY protein
MHEHRDEYRDSSRGGRGGGGPGRGGRGGGYGQQSERRGIPLAELDPTTTASSRKVIGCAIEVHKALGPGFDASVYAKALQIELDGQAVKYKCDHKIPVKYKEKQIGDVRADLFVEDLFLVCVSATPGPVGTPERMALRGQLKAADLDLGLIINFAERRLKDGLVRVLNIDKINFDRGDEGMEEEEGQDGPSDQPQEFDSGH